MLTITASDDKKFIVVTSDSHYEVSTQLWGRADVVIVGDKVLKNRFRPGGTTATTAAKSPCK